MRAVVASEPGDVDVLEVVDLPVPEPGPGEVLIEVAAAGVNRADLMQRNLDRRIETLFPIEDLAMIRHIREDLLATYLNDNIRAKLLMPDGSYMRAQPAPDAAPRDSQAFFAAGHDVPPD